jgi:hypothetical protein
MLSWLTLAQPRAAVSWTCVLILAIFAGGCESSGPEACVAAGGRCMIPGPPLACLERGPQDCNPTLNPGGAFCCLKSDPQPVEQSHEPTAVRDAGSGAVAPAAGAQSVSSRGPAECAAAGGRCILGSYQGCGEVGPFECNPERNPGGAFCCLKDKPQPVTGVADAGGSMPRQVDAAESDSGVEQSAMRR